MDPCGRSSPPSSLKGFTSISHGDGPDRGRISHGGTALRCSIIGSGSKDNDRELRFLSHGDSEGAHFSSLHDSPRPRCRSADYRMPRHRPCKGRQRRDVAPLWRSPYRAQGRHSRGLFAQGSAFPSAAIHQESLSSSRLPQVLEQWYEATLKTGTSRR